MSLQQEQDARKDARKQQWVRVALASQDGKTTYASATFMVNTTRAWELYNATLSPHETDTLAVLTIAFEVLQACCLPHTAHRPVQCLYTPVSACLQLIEPIRHNST